MSPWSQGPVMSHFGRHRCPLSLHALRVGPRGPRIHISRGRFPFSAPGPLRGEMKISECTTELLVTWPCLHFRPISCPLPEDAVL